MMIRRNITPHVKIRLTYAFQILIASQSPSKREGQRVKAFHPHATSVFHSERDEPDNRTAFPSFSLHRKCGRMGENKPPLCLQRSFFHFFRVGIRSTSSCFFLSLSLFLRLPPRFFICLPGNVNGGSFRKRPGKCGGGRSNCCGIAWKTPNVGKPSSER